MDARKSLTVLRSEWSECTKCELGQRRISYDTELVFGKGTPGGVMFIGGGPTKDDEIGGQPFSSQHGTILRRVIEKLGLRDFYLTHVTACRSCSPYIDAVTGQPSMRRNWKTRQMEISYRDDPPTPLQIDACLARLHEQIYLVDPVVIVTLGPDAAKALLHKAVNLSSAEVRGKPFHVSIPGAGFRTVRTDKKEAWVRAANGKIQMPVAPSEVRYLCIPTYNTDTVFQKLADRSAGSPFDLFARDIQKAARIYERYLFELYGTLPTSAAAQEMEFTEEEVSGTPQD